MANPWNFGSLGVPCCCIQAGCNYGVDTTWCGCKIPGTITTTAQLDNSSGAVVATATAGTNGRSVLTIPSSASGHKLYLTASTTTSGYTNKPNTTATVFFTSNGNPCDDGDVGADVSRLFPSSFSVTISDLGAFTITGLVDASTGTIGVWDATLFMCTFPATSFPVLAMNKHDLSDSRQYNLSGVGPHFTPCIPVNLTGTDISGSGTSATVTQ